MTSTSSLKTPFRIIRQVVVAMFIAVALWSVLIMVFESRFIFFPDRYPNGRYNETVRIHGLRDEWFRTSDGIQLHGWYAPALNPLATIVMAHGNAGNLSGRLELIRALQQANLNVFIFDYRGYGRSEGEPDEAGVYLDGRAAFDHACTLAAVDTEKLFLWGTSLGGAVALDVALDRPAAGLILESTFTSVPAMAAKAYPWLPVRSFLRTQFNSLKKIATYRGPLLIIHGRRDSLVPFEMGQELFDAATGEKEFYEIVMADHNDTYWIGGKEYVERARGFVARIVGRMTASAKLHGLKPAP